MMPKWFPLMTPYGSLALLYDDLMAEVDYNAWADYLDAAIKQFGAPGRELLDLGCGTGTLTIAMQQKGYLPIGVDLSPEMLAIAVNKGLAYGLGIANWTTMDMRSLRFPPASFDIAVCACDGFNYLRGVADLESVLSNLSRILRPEGLLLFDMHTDHKMRHVFPSGPFVQESETGYCIWWSQYDPGSSDATHDLTFFIQEEDELWRRFDETHLQHYFDPTTVQRVLAANGFALVAIVPWGQLVGEASDTTERLQFVARRDY